jgi:hypothetical protein
MLIAASAAVSGRTRYVADLDQQGERPHSPDELRKAAFDFVACSRPTRSARSGPVR